MNTRARALAALADALLPRCWPLTDRPTATLRDFFFRAHRQLGQHDRAFVATACSPCCGDRRSLSRTRTDECAARAGDRCRLAELGLACAMLDDALAPDEPRVGARVQGAQARSHAGRGCRSARLALGKLWERLSLRNAMRWREHGLPRRHSIFESNPFKMSRDAARAVLAADGIDPSPTPYSPLGLRVAGKPACSAIELFIDGRDRGAGEGSQLLCFLVAPKRSR